MNRKIERVREDLKKTRAKMRELEEYEKTLEIKERQLCDEEVAKTIRAMTERGGDVLDTLKGIMEEYDVGNADPVFSASDREEDAQYV